MDTMQLAHELSMLYLSRNEFQSTDELVKKYLSVKQEVQQSLESNSQPKTPVKCTLYHDGI